MTVEPQCSRPDPSDLRIGNPERQMAIEALETHLTAKRLNSAEYEQRIESCELARTQAELLRIFYDLPAPHPQLPSAAAQAAEPEDGDDIPPVAVTGCLTLGLGIPVAVVLGIAYGAWWALAVPVAVTVAMSYVALLRAEPRGQGPEDGPRRPE
jgi:Domain of unknown function (DUF1707)